MCGSTSPAATIVNSASGEGSGDGAGMGSGVGSEEGEPDGAVVDADGPDAPGESPVRGWSATAVAEATTAQAITPLAAMRPHGRVRCARACRMFTR